MPLHGSRFELEYGSSDGDASARFCRVGFTDLDDDPGGACAPADWECARSGSVTLNEVSGDDDTGALLLQFSATFRRRRDGPRRVLRPAESLVLSDALKASSASVTVPVGPRSSKKTGPSGAWTIAPRRRVSARARRGRGATRFGALGGLGGRRLGHLLVRRRRLGPTVTAEGEREEQGEGRQSNHRRERPTVGASPSLLTPTLRSCAIAELILHC